MLPCKIPKLPTYLTCERVFCYRETSPSRLLPQNRFVSINLLPFLLFLPFCLPHLKRLDCHFEYLGSSASIQKLFWGSYSTSRSSFGIFVGEKVVSPSFPPPSQTCLLNSGPNSDKMPVLEDGSDSLGTITANVNLISLTMHV